jgi:cytochrome bd-type quinol oxidase subunit 2
MSQNMRQLIRFVCVLLLVAAIGVVVWMANEISPDNIYALRDWNPLYDYIIMGVVVLSCVLLGALAVTSKRVTRITLVASGIFLAGERDRRPLRFQILQPSYICVRSFDCENAAQA